MVDLKQVAIATKVKNKAATNDVRAPVFRLSALYSSSLLYFRLSTLLSSSTYNTNNNLSFHELTSSYVESLLDNFPR